MAWGLEARVPFLDKAFLEVAMNIDAKEKQFSKGAQQEVDEDGRPKMEKVRVSCRVHVLPSNIHDSTSCGKRSTVHQAARSVLQHFCSNTKSESPLFRPAIPS
jgi:asparagine synthetase B (glutamine-hydrolysing)